MKGSIFRTLFAGLLILLFSSSTFSQTTYYVAVSGNDSNNGTTLTTPLATIAKAVSKATVPGDAILVRSGTYTVSTRINITAAGTAAKHITLSVYKPDIANADSRPVIDFSSMTVSSSNRGLQLSGANYWDIYGLVIKGAGDNGMSVSGTSFTTIEFCAFTRNRDSGLQIGGASQDITIINCDSYENADLGTGTSSQGGNADGFAPKLDVGTNIVFRGCRAWMNSDDGWDGYLRTGSPGVLDNITTRLEDCWAFKNGYYWLDGSTTSSENGNGFKMGGSDNKDEAHNFILVKCLSFQNKANGFDQNSNAGSIYLYNCTAYSNNGRDFYLTSSPVTYKTGAELVLKNNLSLGAKGVSIPSSGTATRSLVAVTNSFKTTTTSPEIISFDMTGAAGMRSVNGSLPLLDFMRLDITAVEPFTYIDKGTSLTEVTYHGILRVPLNGAAPDLGAFESLFGVPVTGLADPTEKLLEVLIYPNPTHAVFNLQYTIEATAIVSLSVFDGQGRLISFLEEQQGAGRHERTIRGDYFVRGKYYIKLMVGDRIVYRSVIVE